MYANLRNVRNNFAQFVPFIFLYKESKSFIKTWSYQHVTAVKILLTFNMPYGVEVLEIRSGSVVVFGPMSIVY
jgi:hypothetical protein